MTKDSEDRIRKAFAQKDLEEIKARDSWHLFKIMSEFVEGFEKMSRIGPCVSIFGSARTKPENPYFKLAEEIVRVLQAGYKEGITPLTDVLSAESALTIARVNRLTALYDVKIAQINLLRAYGQTDILIR